MTYVTLTHEMSCLFIREYSCNISIIFIYEFISQILYIRFCDNYTIAS